MACATLKRSLDFDPLHTSPRSPKRRRCMPMTQSPLTPPTKAHQVNPSPFGAVSPKVKSAHIVSSLAAELKRMQRRKQLHFPSSSHSQDHFPSSSHSQDHVTEALSDSDSNSDHSDAMQTCSASPSSSATSLFTALSPSKREAPLFTFQQVSLFCERMLREREEQIRSDYDKVLSCKLAEQYEAFLKFNHDQLQKRFSDSSPSYVS